MNKIQHNLLVAYLNNYELNLVEGYKLHSLILLGFRIRNP
jgi:hypothetical protein